MIAERWSSADLRYVPPTEESILTPLLQTEFETHKEDLLQILDGQRVSLTASVYLSNETGCSYFIVSGDFFCLPLAYSIHLLTEEYPQVTSSTRIGCAGLMFWQSQEWTTKIRRRPLNTISLRLLLIPYPKYSMV